MKYTKTLEMGMAGPEIIILQTRLKELNYFKGECKGNFKSLTETAVRLFQTQHIDPQTKQPLEVDGIVGPATVRALNKPSGVAQKNFFNPRKPKGLPPIRSAILDEFERLHQAGVREIPRGSNWGDGIPQFGGRKGWAWCALCYTTVCRRGGVDCPRRARVYTIWKEAEKNGSFYPIDSTDPLAFLPGNALIWQHKNSRGAWTKTGHIAGINIPVLWPDGRLKECNTYGGNEGHRLKYGYRRVWVKKNGVYTHVSSKDLIGTINPLFDKPLENVYTIGKSGIQKAPSAEGSTR